MYSAGSITIAKLTRLTMAMIGYSACTDLAVIWIFGIA
jgi:hypothetical protein